MRKYVEEAILISEQCRKGGLEIDSTQMHGRRRRTMAGLYRSEKGEECWTVGIGIWLLLIKHLV